MEELKKHIISLSRQLKGRSANIAFWKKDERWCNCTFELKSDNTIDTFIKRFLENVQKDDPKAVVVNSGDFIEANGDGYILVDDMVSSVLYLYSRGQANISDFLDYYAHKEEQEQTKQKELNRKVLEEVIKCCRNEVWKEHCSKAVFWETEKCWNYHMFSLSENNIIPREDEVILREIQKKDNNAIVVDKYSFYCLSVKYVAEKIKQYRQNETNRNHNLNSNIGHNIGVFLDKYSWSAVAKKHEEKGQEAKQKTLTFNKKQFQQSELGFMLNACIIDLWYARKKALSCDMKYSNYMQCVEAYMMAVKAILMVLNKCYKVKYTIRINDKECSIVSQDGSDFLFKFEIEENGEYLIEKKV